MVQDKLSVKCSALTQIIAILLGQNMQHYLSVCPGTGNNDLKFQTLTFGNQTHMQEVAANATAECVGSIRAEQTTKSTSQITAIPLFYTYCSFKSISNQLFFVSKLQERKHLGIKGKRWLLTTCGAIWTAELVRCTGLQKQFKEKNSSQLYYFSLLRSHAGSTQKIINATADATEEVQTYLAGSYLSRGEDPLNYWATWAAVYPNLFKLAIRYLHMPAMSVPCKRVLSKAGEVASRKRSKLKPKSFEMIFFLKVFEPDAHTKFYHTSLPDHFF